MAPQPIETTTPRTLTDGAPKFTDWLPDDTDSTFWLRSLQGELKLEKDSIHEVYALLQDYQNEFAKQKAQSAEAIQALRIAKREHADLKDIAARLQAENDQLTRKLANATQKLTTRQDQAAKQEREVRMQALEARQKAEQEAAHYARELAMSKVRMATLMEDKDRLMKLVLFYASHIAECCPELLVSPRDKGRIESLDFTDAKTLTPMSFKGRGGNPPSFSLWKALGLSSNHGTHGSASHRGPDNSHSAAMMLRAAAAAANSHRPTRYDSVDSPVSSGMKVGWNNSSSSSNNNNGKRPPTPSPVDLPPDHPLASPKGWDTKQQQVKSAKQDDDSMSSSSESPKKKNRSIRSKLVSRLRKETSSISWRASNSTIKAKQQFHKTQSLREEPTDDPPSSTRGSDILVYWEAQSPATRTSRAASDTTDYDETNNNTPLPPPTVPPLLLEALNKSPATDLVTRSLPPHPPPAPPQVSTSHGKKAWSIKKFYLPGSKHSSKHKKAINEEQPVLGQTTAVGSPLLVPPPVGGSKNACSSPSSSNCSSASLHVAQSAFQDMLDA